jgi:hypothetical protein
LVRLRPEIIENAYHEAEPSDGKRVAAVRESIRLDLPVDLNTIEESGLPWAFLDDASDSSVVVPGRFLIVGSGLARAVAQVVDVEDGIVHVRPQRGSVASNRHLLVGHGLAS